MISLLFESRINDLLLCFGCFSQRSLFSETKKVRGDNGDHKYEIVPWEEVHLNSLQPLLCCTETNSGRGGGGASE